MNIEKEINSLIGSITVPVMMEIESKVNTLLGNVTSEEGLLQVAKDCRLLENTKRTIAYLCFY